MCKINAISLHIFSTWEKNEQLMQAVFPYREKQLMWLFSF